MRLSGVMDADQGVAVAAFVSEGQVERQWRPAVALTDDERGGRQHSWRRLRQLAPEALRQAIWRGGEEGRGGGGGPPPRAGGAPPRPAAPGPTPPPRRAAWPRPAPAR